MVAKDEGDTEEEQQEGDQEDQGELLLQVGQPAGLATIFNFIQPVGRASSLSCSGDNFDRFQNFQENNH